ncbi:unnamed protein product [Phaedon cochleariae]|uniref:PHD-type domain-containing protein n=1 Tax=Phaedon cochleariae TaxID=80249 RepID=A0A9N9SKH1_PHACE|nr:unnamed protein product [Phaedon cochleariae]
MPICSTCTSAITSKTPGLPCSGSCEKYFHGKCVGLSGQDVGRLIMPGALWNCADCRSVSQKRASLLAAGNDDEIEGECSISSMSILKEIQTEMKAFNSKYDTILESVNFCSNQITTFERLLSELNKRMTTIEKLSKENADLKVMVGQLTTRIDNIEQQARLNNIEIQGVPEKSNENIIQILEHIGQHIQCTISPSNVNSTHRVAHSTQSEKPKSIIVKFHSKVKRDEILAAAKIKRLSYSDKSQPGLVIENISRGLFINEHLTTNTKLLLKKAKDMSKSNNYKFVWVRNGGVFARKNERSKVLRIVNEKLIEIIIKKKVPNDVKLSENVRRMIEGGDNCEFFDSISDSQPFDITNKLTITNLKCEIKCKDTEIDCLQRLNSELVRSITDKETIISLLNSDIQNRNRPSGERKQHYNVATLTNSTRASVISKPQTESKKNYSTIASKQSITVEQVSESINQAGTSKQNQHLVQPNEHNVTPVVTPWTTVNHRKKRSELLVGTNSLSNSSLKGIPKTMVLHVSRLNPNTTTEDLKSFLKPNFPEVVCENWKSIVPEIYALFKVTIYDKNSQKAMESSVWPEDAHVQRFFFSKRTWKL